MVGVTGSEHLNLGHRRPERGNPHWRGDAVTGGACLNDVWSAIAPDESTSFQAIDFMALPTGFEPVY
jgi:hypothetical protein